MAYVPVPGWIANAAGGTIAGPFGLVQNITEAPESVSSPEGFDVSDVMSANVKLKSMIPEDISSAITNTFGIELSGSERFEAAAVLSGVLGWWLPTELSLTNPLTARLTTTARTEEVATAVDHPIFNLGVEGAESLTNADEITQLVVKLLDSYEIVDAVASLTSGLSLSEALQEQLSGADFSFWLNRVLVSEGIEISYTTPTGNLLRIREIVAATGILSSGSSISPTTIESLGITDAVLYIASLIGIEAVEVSELSEVDFTSVFRVIEAIGVVSQVLPKFALAGSLLQGLSVTDLLTIYDALLIAEGLTISDSLSKVLTVEQEVVEALSTVDITTQAFTVIAPTQESLVAEDASTLSLAAALLLEESIAFIGRLPIGADEYQAWVINTDSFGVTQYTNFPFVDLTEYQGQVYGITETGLYKLSGSDDEGTPIEATIRTGDLNWGNTGEYNVPRCYLYVGSNDELYLKTISALGGERKVYWYSVVARTGDAQNRYMPLGGGVRGFRWAFELTNVDGSSLDLRGFSVKPVLVRLRGG